MTTGEPACSIGNACPSTNCCRAALVDVHPCDPRNANDISLSLSSRIAVTPPTILNRACANVSLSTRFNQFPLVRQLCTPVPVSANTPRPSARQHCQVRSRVILGEIVTGIDRNGAVSRPSVRKRNKPAKPRRGRCWIRIEGNLLCRLSMTSRHFRRYAPNAITGTPCRTVRHKVRGSNVFRVSRK